MLTREQAINAYRRTREWSERQQAILRETILVPHFGGLENCLHNWCLCFERDGSVITQEQYKLARYYRWKQRQVWDTADRLASHFARYF